MRGKKNLWINLRKLTKENLDMANKEKSKVRNIIFCNSGPK